MDDLSRFQHLDILLYAVLPYLAFVIFLLMTIYRYRQQSFTYSSLSSQFLENKRHFWGMVPFHYGILFVLLGHVVAFLIPRSVLWWNSHPARLYILEITALAAGVLTLVGFVSLMLRRLGDTRLRRVTTVSDWVLYGMLVVQIYAGIHVAVFWGWGSSWFAASLSPYLWSLITLSPDITYVTPLPLAFKVHLLGAFALVAYFPFTRLVHVLVIPNMYLWRKPQVVRWYGVRRS